MKIFEKERFGRIELKNCVGTFFLTEVKTVNCDENTIELLFFKNEDNTIDCIELYTEISMCPSGYQEATYGIANIYKNIELPSNYSKFLNKKDLALFNYDEHGGDSYYPSGYAYIEKENFEEIVFMKEEDCSILENDKLCS